MFKNAETGKFSWTNVASTTKLVIKDMFPLSPLYAKTKWRSTLIDNENIPQDFKAPNNELREKFWYLMTPEQRKYIQVLAIATESLGIFFGTNHFLNGEFFSSALVSMWFLSGKTAVMGLVRWIRNDIH